MSPPKVVVFDLDGTLIDSAPVIGGVLNVLRAEAGLPPLPVAAYRGWISHGAAALVGAALDQYGPATPAQLKEFRHHYAASRSTPADLYPGVVESLDALRRAGWAMAVCSNKPQALCEKVLTETGLNDSFRAVAGGDAVAQGKPHPMHLAHALALMGCAGRPFHFVGDSLIDADAAAAAGADFLWASYGYADSDQLPRRGRRLASAYDIASTLLHQQVAA